MNTSIIALLLAFPGPPEGSATPTEEAKASQPATATATASESTSESAKVEQVVTAAGEETTVAETSEASESSASGGTGQPVGRPAGADPDAPPPKPAPPPDGVGAVGSGVQAPLPPPRPPVDPGTIRQGPWRGTGWLSLNLVLEGYVAGEPPARSRVLAIGGAGEVGWRVGNSFGVAVGLARRPHDRVEDTVMDDFTGEQVQVRYEGHLTSFDFVIARLFWPAQGRFQPYVDVGGGMAVVEPPRVEDEVLVGSQFRGSLGFDAWVARTVTIGVGVQYRIALVEQSVGHHLGGSAGIGLHW